MKKQKLEMSLELSIFCRGLQQIEIMELGPELRMTLNVTLSDRPNFFIFPFCLTGNDWHTGSKTAKIELCRLHKSSIDVRAIFLSLD